MRGRENGARGAGPPRPGSRVPADLHAAPSAGARPAGRRRREPVHAPDAQEILGPVPGRLLRWGIPLISLALGLVLLAAWVIRYPQVLAARITVTAAAPPAGVVARTAGPLVLLVRDQSRVFAGAHLAYVAGAARYEDVAALRSALARAGPRIRAGERVTGFAAREEGALGELAEPYARFLEAYRDYESFHASPYYAQRLAALADELAAYAALREQLLRTRSLAERELALAARERERQRQLLAAGHIPATEVAAAEREYLRVEGALEQVNSSLTGNDLQRLQQQSAAAQWRHEHEEGRRVRMLALQSAFRQLESRLAEWEAPVDGTVAFFRFWSSHQQVAAGEEVMTVVPSGPASRLVGRAPLPLAGAGRVLAGQAVRVRFDSYPADEFGVVEGRVEAVSLVPRGERYLLEVGFPSGLRTSYRGTLPFRPEMQGTAEVVTDDLRLIERIFSRLRSVLRGTGGRPAAAAGGASGGG